MLDHVGIPVSDFERSKRFYEQALSPLGYGLIMEPRRGAAGLGRSGKPDFWVFRGEPASAVHVAFAADDRASVDAFHEAAIAAGTTMVVPGLARVPSVLLWGLRPRSGRQQHRSGQPWAGRGSLSRRTLYSRECAEGIFSDIRMQHLRCFAPISLG